MMDYSVLPTDVDHPAGSSPWATSPQASRPTFSAADVPSSPLPQQHASPLPSPYSPDSNEGRPEPFAQPETLISRAGTFQRRPDSDTTQTSEDSPSSPDLSARLQSPRFGEADFPGGAQVPQQQQRRPDIPGRYHNTGKQQARQPLPQYKLQAKITGLERTGRKDPILRFDVHTNLPKFRTTQFRDVRRTHSEFVKLAKHLGSSNPEALVPAVPPPITAAGVGTDEDEIRIKAAMQRWLSYVCGNDVLMRDDEMVFFVESDFGYSPVHRMKQPATGVRRKVLKQFAPPPDETPELHDARPVVKLFYLGTMETGQKVDKVVKARRSLGLAESDLGVKFTAMHVQETHPGLANAYRKLGKVVQTTGDFHAAQGTAEAATLADPLNYHSSDALIVKETLTNRHILLRELIQAQGTTKSKRSAAERIKASSSVRAEKADEVIHALEEAQSHETFLTQKFERVTANLLQEKRRWFVRTSADLRASIREYVLREIEAERRTLASLESVRGDVRAIDGSGGLSRLGREAHPVIRRTALASSQGPRGDAWSGIPRRADALNRSVTGSFVPPLVDDNDVNGEGGKGRTGPLSKATVKDEDDDRVDARNAASRLAASTF